VSERAWLLVGLCAVTTAMIRGTGPAAVGGRELGARTSKILALLPAALLAALVVSDTLLREHDVVVDARAGGVAAAGLLLWRGVSVVWVVAAAAAVTALLRLAF
jgi:branched-subunit amino acid transport protein